MNEWAGQAACDGHPDGDAFFPPEHKELKAEKLARQARAKAVCAGCPVAEPCGEYATVNRIVQGIWGGMTEAERKGRARVA